MRQREKSLSAVKLLALGDIGNRILSQLDSSKINPDISVILMNDTNSEIQCPWNKTNFFIANRKLTDHQKAAFCKCISDAKVIIIMVLIPLGHISPGRLGRYARRYGVNAVTALREYYFKGDQSALRPANMISNWLSTMSQF